MTVPGDQRFCLLVDGRSVSGTLQKLSLTGGCGELDRPLKQNSIAELTLQTRFGPITGVVEMLNVVSTQPSTQGFRFIAISDQAHSHLGKALQQMSR